MTTSTLTDPITQKITELAELCAQRAEAERRASREADAQFDAEIARRLAVYADNHPADVRDVAEIIDILSHDDFLGSPDDSRHDVVHEALTMWATAHGITAAEVDAAREEYTSAVG